MQLEIKKKLLVACIIVVGCETISTGIPDPRLQVNEALRAKCLYNSYLKTDLEIVEKLATFEVRKEKGETKAAVLATALSCFVSTFGLPQSEIDYREEACRECNKACIDQIYGP